MSSCGRRPGQACYPSNGEPNYRDYRDYIGIIGIDWGYMEMMERKMETTVMGYVRSRV